MTTQPTTLFDRRSRTLVPATVRFNLTADQILAVEAVWSSCRESSVERLVESGFPEEQMPQHWHWDWTHKVQKLEDPSCRGIGVECEGEMQGMMLISLANYSARVGAEAGSPLVYINYLESAPWNVKPLAEDPRYGAVGARLVLAVVRISIEAGCHGRLGLHSLPQAEHFYEAGCGMSAVGVDSDQESLKYFELTREQAKQLLDNGDSI